MHNIVIGRQQFRGPKAWEQLSAARFAEWVRWQLMGAPTEGLYVLLQRWYGISRQLLRSLDSEQRIFLIEEVFAWQNERPSIWLLPRLRVGLRRYRGPGDRLQNLTFGEFMFAEAARSGLTRQAMDEQPTPAQLAELAAALYRPVDHAGEGERATFDRRLLDRQINRFERLPGHVLHGVLINYYGCQDHLTGLFTHLYPKEPTGEASGTWLDVGLNLARQTGALGNFHELERTNIYLVLTVLNDVMKEQAELKAKLDSHE